MTWLLRLYPSPWRRRYGAEVAEMLGNSAFSFRTAVDLIAGAIDVWLHPSATLAAASAADVRTGDLHTEEKSMLSRIIRLDCAGAYGPNLTKADSIRAGSVMIGWTLVLTGIWLAARIRYGSTPYVESMSFLPFMISLVASMRYTYLKGRPNSVQAVFIGGLSLVLFLIALVAGWLAAQL